MLKEQTDHDDKVWSLYYVEHRLAVGGSVDADEVLQLVDYCRKVLGETLPKGSYLEEDENGKLPGHVDCGLCDDEKYKDDDD